VTLSIGKLTAGREDYYLGALSADRDEYYLNPTEIPGVWHGVLAGRLGLSGRVDPDAFRAVLAARHPGTSDPLVGGLREGRVTGFDLTFSAPKSVSLLWALSDTDVSDAVAAAHDAAVADAFAALEAEAVFARRGHDGATRIRAAGLVAAGFGHRTSRAGDPQLHTHLVTANLTVGADGRWSAPDGRAVYGWAKTVGYLYQASLRARLTENLGVAFGPVVKGVAEVAGVTAGQRDAFSARRADITAELDRLGWTTARAARTATLTTRPAKTGLVDLDQLRAVWATQADAVDLHITTATTPGRDREVRSPARADLTAALLSPEGLTRQATTFDRRDVLQALAAAQPNGAPAATLRADTDQVTADRAVVPVVTATAAGGNRWTTTELLTVEARLVDRAVTGQHAGRAVVDTFTLDRVLADRPGLSAEQATMISRLVTSGASVDVVVGRAGTGKTYALDAARAAWQNCGHPVIGTALAARAAAELQAGAGIPATTIDRLLADLDRPGPLAGLAPRTVVIVDEAGMVETRKLDRLLTHAGQAQAKVVLVGDPAQLPEIDAGGTLAHLAHQLPTVELVDNRRQTDPWERAALDQLRSGSVPAAVAAYHQAGRITLTPTAPDARRALVNDWWATYQHPTPTPTGTDAQAGVGVGRSAMYALTRADVTDLNTRARAHLRAAGRLTGPDTTIAGREFAPGDHVLTLRNDRRIGIRNGTTGTLLHITPDRAVINTADGTVTLPGDYLSAGHLTHNYATTIHKAQGATVDHAYLLGSDQLFREAGYVAFSRARTTTRLYLVQPDTPTPDRAGTPGPVQIPGMTPAGEMARFPGTGVHAVGDVSVLLSRSRAQTLARDHTAPSISQAAVLADPPAWAVTTLGPPPLWGADRDRWADTATRIGHYRATYPPGPDKPARALTALRPTGADRPVRDTVEEAIGPEPADRRQHRDWTVVRTAITQTRRHGLHRDLDQGRTR
jgi:conjugative relaxase-like TrwC/TraI family protein